jgi:hypothetical protein
MKKQKTIFLLFAIAYALLLALTLNHNTINLKPSDAPKYIGRNSLTNK